MTENKILIAYFSRTGRNYGRSGIEILSVGNTAVVAEDIRDLTGGELFEIRTVDSYPEDYSETTRIARKELNDGARPKLLGSLPDPDGCTTVFLGYPNWWGTMPMAVFTFLESLDFTEKTIIPFCTHEGSGMGSSEHDLKEACPNANVEKGLALRGSRVNQSRSEVKRWLKNLGHAG